jgi:hypothetical protein
VEDPIGFLDFSCFGDSYTFHPWVLPIRIRVAAPFSWPELIDVGAPPARSRVLRAQDRRLIGDLPDLTKAMADANVDFTSGLSGLGHALLQRQEHAGL